MLSGTRNFDQFEAQAEKKGEGLPMRVFEPVDANGRAHSDSENDTSGYAH